MLNYNKLYYFYKILQAQNLTDAARLLHVSQPALSKAIHDLEQDFEIKLFEKKGVTLQLTPAGKVLKEECQSLFQNEKQMIRRVKEVARKETGRINFGYMVFREIFYIIPFLREMERSNPEITINSSQYYERRDITSELLEGKLDVIVKMYGEEELIPELEYHMLQESHLGIVMRKDHPLARKSSLNLGELKDEHFVMIGKGKKSSEQSQTLRWCRGCGFEPYIVFQSSDIGAVLLMVQGGAGISILSSFAPINHYTNLIFVPLENAIALYSGIFWRKGEARNGVLSFIEHYLEMKEKY